MVTSQINAAAVFLEHLQCLLHDRTEQKQMEPPEPQEGPEEQTERTVEIKMLEKILQFQQFIWFRYGGMWAGD